MGGGIVEHALAIEHGQRIRDHQNGVRRFTVHHRECLVEIVRFAHPHRLDRNPDRSGRFRRGVIAQRHPEVVFVPQHRHALKFRQQLLEQSQPLGGQRRRHVGYAGDAAPGSGKIINEAGRNRIADAERDDGGNPGELGGEHHRIAPGDNDIDLVRLQLLYQLRNLNGLPGHAGRALEHQILPDDVAKLRQRAEQKFCVRLGLRDQSSRTDQRKAIDLRWGLGDGISGRRNGHAAQKSNELTPLHVSPEKCAWSQT